MTNDDLKRFYEENSIPEKRHDFVRYDDKGNVKVSDNPGAKDAVNRDFIEREIGAVEGNEILMSILADTSPITHSQEGFIVTYHNGGELLIPFKGSDDIVLDVSEDGQYIVARLDNTLKLQEINFSSENGMYVSNKVFEPEQHVHLLFEIETEGTHSGTDFVLHPYNSSVCHTTFTLLIGGQFVNGFAYLDETNRIRISFQENLFVTNIVAHYQIIV